MINLKFSVIFLITLSTVKVKSFSTVDPSLSYVLQEIAAEFFLKHNREFMIMAHSSVSINTLAVVNDFMSKSEGKFSYQFSYLKGTLYAEYNVYLTFALPRSGFVFFENLEDLVEFDSDKQVLRFQNEPIKFIIYVADLSFESLMNSPELVRYAKLNIFAHGLFLNGFFVINEANWIALVSTEWFGSGSCNNVQFRIVDIYFKDTKKWQWKLTSYEKFLNFFGCELVLMLPVPHSNQILYHISGYAMVKKDYTEFAIFGITPEVFKIAGRFHNFTPGFQPALVKYDFFKTINRQDAILIKINYTVKHPHVFFQVVTTRDISVFNRMSNVFASDRDFLIVTPGEAYTQYEKLALPFDLETWILLFVTFFITFVTILVIDRLPRSIKSVVFGERIENPFWNVVSIFFGVSQTQLPVSSFPRFILTLFIWFCLIFRTCFQSKFFEFMTSEPRRMPPKTVLDVLERNYTVYFVNFQVGNEVNR